MLVQGRLPDLICSGNTCVSGFHADNVKLILTLWQLQSSECVGDVDVATGSDAV